MQSSSGRPQLHVGTAYSTCYFELHPELTPAQVATFAGELGAIMRPPQLEDTATLGKHQYEISVQYTSTGIDDAKGAWNNTMTDPAADHYLGDSIAPPRVVARFGQSNRVDFDAWGTPSPHSNYGVVGGRHEDRTPPAGTRLARVGVDPAKPLVACRPVGRLAR